MAKTPFGLSGMVAQGNSLLVKGLDGRVIINEKVGDLRASWKKTLDW